ncbi:hypothetical protein U1Q18_027344 [Sarracenia purpurea var. burkii]
MTVTSISNENPTNTTTKIKFLYSYGGKILPRRTDGKLRYVGGLTRVLAVHRSITFAELMVRFGELCGSSVSLKCKLPTEDLDLLISITSDQDLANVIDEYDRFSLSTHKDVKIIAVLVPIKSLKKISPVSSAEDLCSTGSSVDLSPTASPPYSVSGFRSSPPHIATAACRCGGRNTSPSFRFPVGVRKDACEVRNHHPCCEGNLRRDLYRCCEQGRPRHIHVVPYWNGCN